MPAASPSMFGTPRWFEPTIALEGGPLHAFRLGRSVFARAPEASRSHEAAPRAAAADGDDAVAVIATRLLCAIGCELTLARMLAVVPDKPRSLFTRPAT